MTAGSRATPAFVLVVALTLLLFGLVGVVLVQPELVSGVLGHDVAQHVSGHFRFAHHRVHDITFGLIVGTAVAGMMAQLWRRTRTVATQLMALVPWVALGLAFVLAGRRMPFAPAPVLAGLTLLAALLHPERPALVRSLTARGVSLPLLALVIAAALPLAVLAWRNVHLQRTVINDHAALGHYGFMAAFSFTVTGAGIVASFRPSGWRLTTPVTGTVVALFGLASLFYPVMDSSLSTAWAIGAIVWGIAFTLTGVIGSRSW